MLDPPSCRPPIDEKQQLPKIETSLPAKALACLALMQWGQIILEKTTTGLLCTVCSMKAFGLAAPPPPPAV
jgi:hypothetical protein